jgi:hypothetical protein
MRLDDTNDAESLALAALGWTVRDEERAQRLLALTGLDAAGLRRRAGDRDLLVALLRFLEAHEPDLVACAIALEVPPVALVAARRMLES